jgi:non-specific serine/threonine protein kinase
VRGRHLSFFLRLVQEAEQKLLGEDQALWLDRLEREHDNLHAAIEWSLEAEEGWKEGLPLMRDLFSYWDLRLRFGGALEYLKRFVARSADWPIEQRARGLRLTGFVAMKQADYATARRYFEEGRTLRRQQGMTDEDPRDLQCYGALALHEGDYAQAEALLQQGLRTYRKNQEVGTEFQLDALGWHLDLLGLVAYHQADIPSAASYSEESLALFREANHETGIASALHGLGRVAMREGEYPRARLLLHESLARFRDVKAKHSAVTVLNSLAWICWHQAEHAAARAHLDEALLLCRETGRYWETIDTLVSAGHLAQRQGDAIRAVRLFAAAESLRGAIGEAMPPVERAEYEESIRATRAALGEEAFTAGWAAGRAMTRDQAVSFAVSEQGTD